MTTIGSANTTLIGDGALEVNSEESSFEGGYTPDFKVFLKTAMFFIMHVL